MNLKSLSDRVHLDAVQLGQLDGLPLELQAVWSDFFGPARGTGHLR
jgi:hypothetical protein